MKLLNYLFTLGLSLLFISCGDSTTTSPLTDITSISIDDTNISIYATDASIDLTATVTYSNATTANATKDLTWSSSETSVLTTTVGQISAASNGGDVNLSIDYADTFSDTQPVHIKQLVDINVSDINISDIGTPQVIYFSGIFENNETNIILANNITWYSDENSTISDFNTTQLTLTVDANTTSVLLRAVLFTNTLNAVDFNTTFN